MVELVSVKFCDSSWISRCRASSCAMPRCRKIAGELQHHLVLDEAVLVAGRNVDAHCAARAYRPADGSGPDMAGAGWTERADGDAGADRDARSNDRP